MRTLDDDVVAAALEHPDSVDVIGPFAEHDHRRVRVRVAGKPVAGADGVDELERLSVDVRDDQVGLVDGQQGDRLGAVLRRCDAVAVGGQVGLENTRVASSSSASRMLWLLLVTCMDLLGGVLACSVALRRATTRAWPRSRRLRHRWRGLSAVRRWVG
jgi:hypothetical protein